MKDWDCIRRFPVVFRTCFPDHYLEIICVFHCKWKGKGKKANGVVDFNRLLLFK